MVFLSAGTATRALGQDEFRRDRIGMDVADGALAEGVTVLKLLRHLSCSFANIHNISAASAQVALDSRRSLSYPFAANRVACGDRCGDTRVRRKKSCARN